jgi:hypothetical protein
MKQEARSSDREVLAGLVERVTFHSADSGFCVLRIKARGHRELVTVVGHAAVISAGEWVTALLRPRGPIRRSSASRPIADSRGMWAESRV